MEDYSVQEILYPIYKEMSLVQFDRKIKLMKENPAEFKRQYPDFKPYQREQPTSNPFAIVANKLIKTQSGITNAVIHGKREGATRRFKEYLYNEGEVPIKNIYIGRHPIIAGVDLTLNVLSLGGFHKVQKDLDYDAAYHNYLVIEGEDGSLQKIERNHVVESFDISKNSPDWRDEAYSIPLDGRKITARELIQNTEAVEGQQLYQYNAASNNCQKFTYDLLKDNDLLKNVTDEKAMEVIDPQDAQAFINSLGLLRGIPLVTTDLAGALDRVVHGDGLVGVRGCPKFKRVGGRVGMYEMFHRINYGFPTEAL